MTSSVFPPVRGHRPALREQPVVAQATPEDADDNAGALAQAIDETLDACDDAWAAGEMGVARALLTAAMATCDELLEVLGVVDPDEVGDTDGPAD